jgi:3D-(3,5/4)-trihydroxycyclohexane-1,2-dione acylhydrolase (decyclizing)
MMPSDLVTSIQEGYKLTVVLLDNHGFSSIGGLSQSAGSGGFGTQYRYRNPQTGQLDGEYLPVNFAANARSLGAHVLTAKDLPELRAALAEAQQMDRTTVIVAEVDREQRVPGYESWWDVPVAEVAETAAVQEARRAYEIQRARERYFLA